MKGITIIGSGGFTKQELNEALFGKGKDEREDEGGGKKEKEKVRNEPEHVLDVSKQHPLDR